MESLFYILFSFNTINLAIGQNNIVPSGYNPRIAPNSRGVTNVNISATVNSLIAVSESTQSFQLDLTLNLKWIDNRLIMNSSQSTNSDNQMTDILLDSSYVSKFWTPDVYFRNALTASVVSSGLSLQYIAIGVNNNITYTRRLSATFSCKMDLSNYPQDYQYCSIVMSSFTKRSTQLVLNWEEFNAGFSDYPKFRIRNSYTDNCANDQDEFSCQRATLKLVRRVSYYMIRYYCPTFLLVIITFVGFWIPPMGWPARVIVVVTPLLSIITLNINANNDIGVAYVVALHWWMIWCLIFTYLAIIEYAVAISWAHFINDKKALRVETQSLQKGITIVKGHYFGNKTWFEKVGTFVGKILNSIFGSVDYHKEPLVRNKIDYCARVLFPILWINFVLIYILATICPWAIQYNY